MAVRILRDASGSGDGDVARLLEIAGPGWRGGERGRRRGAQCAPAACRSARSTLRPPPCREEVMRRVTAAGWKAVPTGIEHGTVTVVIDGTSVRSDDAAAGRRNLGRKAKVRSAATGARTPSGAISPSMRLSASADGNGVRLRRGPRRYCRAPGALHRRSQTAHRRRLFAHPAVLPLSRHYAEGAPDAAGLLPASRGAPGSRRCRASACAWNS